MSSKKKGIIFIISAAFCFAAMNLFVKLSGDLPSIQKSFFRNFVALIIAVAMLKKSGVKFEFGKGNLKYLLARASFGTIGILTNFYSIDHLKVADASMLNKLSPFFAIIFSYFILKEKVRPFQIVCVITAFIGAMFIIKPGVVGMEVFPAFIGMLGGLTAGIAYTFVRVLGGRGVKGPVIVAFFSGFSCAVTIPFIIFDYSPMTMYQLLMLIGAGTAAAGGQFAITAAYTNAPAREISIYDYSQIIFATVMAFFILGEVPDIYSFLGYIIICGASVTMFLHTNKKDNEEIYE